MRLRRFIAVEIIAHLVAERYRAEQLLGRGERAALAGVEVLDHAAQLREVGPDAAFLVHRLDRAVEEAVRLPGGVADLLLPHGGDRVDAATELGAVDVLRDEVGDERIDPLVELGARPRVDRHQPRRRGRRDGGHRVGRGQHQRRGRGKRVGGGGHIRTPLVAPTVARTPPKRNRVGEITHESAMTMPYTAAMYRLRGDPP